MNSSPDVKTPRKRGPNKAPLPPRTTMHRIRISETMQANKNASAESFVDELEREYADNPEAAEWLANHREALKSANSDGSIPRSSQELVKPNELQLYNGDRVVDAHRV